MENKFNPIKLLNTIGFHRYNAKSTGESLLIHSYNTYFLISQLIKYIPNITEEDKVKLKITSLLHDYGKTYKEYQDKLYGPHKLRNEDVQKIKEIILGIQKMDDKDLDDIIYIIQNHHDIDLDKVNSNRDRLTRIISICDNIVSNEDINEDVINLINSLIDSIEYESFSVELIEHPISSYIIGAFDYIYKKNGIEPILFAKNGTIYIKKKNQKISSIEEVNKYLNEQIESIFGEGCLVFENTNNRIYINPRIFLLLASEPDKFIEVVKSDVEKRLQQFKKSQKNRWNENKEKIYLLGRVCGWIHDSVIELCKVKDEKYCPKKKGGFPTEETVRFIENKYGKNVSYVVIIKKILEKHCEDIKNALLNTSYDIRELLSLNSTIVTETTIDIQDDARRDYNRYWNTKKNSTETCRVCHNFNQEITPAALFPQSELGGTTDVFYTDLMRRPPEFKKMGGVCRWCLLWFLLLKNKTGNKLYKLCVFPHALFGRIEWDGIFDPDQTIRIGLTRENYIYPHVAVVGLSGKTYADFISQAVKNKILDKLYENGLRGKVISTLIEPSFYLFDCGGIKIGINEHNLFKLILNNINIGKGINTYVLAVKSLKNNKYSWGYLIKTNKVRGDSIMVKELGEQTGLSFLKSIWIGGKSQENRISNAEKLVRRMNETLRKLKDKENKDIVIDAMVSIGRKIAMSTREFKDWADERRQKEIDALKKMAEKLYDYRENGTQRTELIRAMACYLGYVPYTIGGEKV